MSLNLPLSVHLETSATKRAITSQLRSLSFRSVANGGFASAAFALERPLILQPEEIAYYGSVFIYDARDGRTIWEGRLEDPGRSARADGTIWDLRSVGPSAHTLDRAVPVIYVDRRISDPPWPQVDLNSSIAAGSADRGDTGTAQSAGVLRVRWDVGAALAANNSDRVVVQYVPCRDTGQFIARIGCDHVEGVTSANVQTEAVGRRAGFAGSDANLESDNWSTTSGSILQRYGNEHSQKYGAVELRIFRNIGSSDTALSSYFTNLSDVHIIGSRYLKDGTEKLSGYTSSTVLASDVVEDLLGRLLTLYDGTNAEVATTTYEIEQLAYPDGVTPANVLSDLLLLEPGYRWGAWESNSAGKHRFEFRAWPTTVRYEADVFDGYTSTGSADGLYNAVRVRYRDAAGQIATVQRTSTVAELDDAGLTREAIIDLGDEVGTNANAIQAGDQFLDEHAYPPNAGRLTIARPIKDLATGKYVMPWEIIPGTLIRVHGILPRINALNASARDGVTVFKINSHEYHTDRAAADLELDSFSASTARALAELQGRPVFRRR